MSDDKKCDFPVDTDSFYCGMIDGFNRVIQSELKKLFDGLDYNKSVKVGDFIKRLGFSLASSMASSLLFGESLIFFATTDGVDLSKESEKEGVMAFVEGTHSVIRQILEESLEAHFKMIETEDGYNIFRKVFKKSIKENGCH